eukprot:15407239-Heterocapsa_arctica.AAC.1
MVSEVDDFRRYFMDMWETGALEIPFLLISAIGALWLILFAPRFLTSSDSTTPPRSPNNSDVDSDRIAGREVDSDADEDNKQLKVMMKTLVEE